MDDEAEAKAHVDDLRRRRHIDDTNGVQGDANARSLASAMGMLSSQLYTKPTHFILEMIQNADDNTYAPGTIPKLTMIYREDGYVFIASNELGFSKDNVAAICEIGNSTKKVNGSQKGYIGEKGIGFKSVFTVADTVWVSSGAFKFKFNRDGLLGMIVPIWSDFKATKAVEEQTMFCLQIPDEKNQREVRGNLLSLGAELLLFLRKLRTIDVKILSADETDIIHEYSLHRDDEDHGTGFTTTHLVRRDLAPEPKTDQETLAVFRSTKYDMPAEPKREGITESEIVMAFPMTNTTKTYRKTYNYLLIRDYGLPFLLQADFLLTASRQDIIEGDAWNNALKSHAHVLFVKGVETFNKTGISDTIASVKYLWPKYAMGTHNPSGTFMDGFLKSLQSYLRHQPVLESQRGDLKPPKSMVYVPERFCDDAGRPLLSDPEFLGNFVAQEYSTNDVNRLGVNLQNIKDFCKLLEYMPPDVIHQKPASWHSRLASALVEASDKSLKEIEIIPLRGGRWVKPSTSSVYFPDRGQVEIPDGIECLVVDDEAAADQSRKKLFLKLGVKTITNVAVCNLIIQRHRSLGTHDTTLSPECLAAHAWYICMTENFLGINLSGLRLAKQGGGLAPARQLYMDGPDTSFKMSQFFPPTGSGCSFIHPVYVNYGDSCHRPRWNRWLQFNAGVSALPRLADALNSKISITPDFRHLIDTQPSSVWMALLRDNWNHYFSKESPESFDLGSEMVNCKNGRRKELSATYLPRRAICGDKFAASLVDFVDVQDPEHTGWDKFRSFGLSTEPDLGLCLDILRAASRDTSSMTLGKEYVISLFKSIEAESLDDADEIRSIFQEEALIPIEDGKSTSWMILDQCRWHAPACLAQLTALDQRFPSLKDFFCVTLQVHNASIGDIVKELRHHAGNMNGVDSLRALLLYLSDCLVNEDQADEHVPKLLLKLQTQQIFPVQRSSGQCRLASAQDHDWFIADRGRIEQCFRGKVWLLDASDSDVKRLAPVFKTLGLLDFYLSKRVIEQTEFTDEPKPCKNLTRYLQGKARFISLLVDEESQKTIQKHIQRIQVLASNNMKLRRYVQVNGKTIYGTDEVGRFVLTESPPLKLYCAESNVASKDPPWAFIQPRLAYMMNLQPSRQLVLTNILTTSSHSMIKDLLERAGLWKDDYIPEALPDQDEDDDEEFSQLVAKSEQVETKPKIKKERREPTAAPTPAGKNSKARSSIAPTSKHTKPMTDKSSSPSTSFPRVKSSVPPQGQQPQHPPAGYEPAESHESRLINSIVAAAETYDINTATLIEASPGGDSQQISALDLLQSSFAVVKSEAQDPDTQFHSELFIYTLLRENFEALQTSWTSPNRTRYNLPAFHPNPNTPNPSTFTISYPPTVQQLTAHLANHNISSANDWLGEPVTYHIDVHASSSSSEDDANEPFAFSNKQVDMARAWMESGRDVHLLVRVQGVMGTPRVRVYVEPLRLVVRGMLEVAAVGGYLLRGV
ncbi:hypothetical protein M409DRAFT_23280 [Zasmidium cellare ATCC 36951]|uniref:Protein NO VEIN C-terminal domain-containing protein n=1 Tax=Zasmidium cellare ATCC 36951 TaxID=1080233 RepID=A0A6A6CLP7_ZASCE|nr:uncharacterized protein M409DRAFT_23280 [Zasmidium cellare ATCC 36951]KAF2166649.1 hypothetical protein M409DRAFT_23280 [Zasmidium cellare ATCC 36951]